MNEVLAAPSFTQLYRSNVIDGAVLNFFSNIAHGSLDTVGITLTRF